MLKIEQSPSLVGANNGLTPPTRTHWSEAKHPSVMSKKISYQLNRSVNKIARDWEIYILVFNGHNRNTPWSHIRSWVRQNWLSLDV